MIPPVLENLKKDYSTCKKYLFSCMSEVYHQPSQEKSKVIAGRLSFYGLNVLILLNTASIIWNHNVNIQKWQDFQTLWLIFEFTRIDVLCAEFYSPHSCIFATYSFVLLVLCLCMLLFLSKYMLKQVPRYLVCAISNILSITEMLNISIFLLLSITLKYSLTHASPSEYDKISVSMDLSLLGILCSIFCMIVIALIGYCRKTFDYDCRHISSSIKAMTCSRVELNSLLCNYISLLLYTFVSSRNFYMYRIVMMIIHGGMAMMYYSSLPYYNFHANFVRSSCNIFAFVSCFIMIIAYAIDNAMFGIYGICLIIPITLCIWYSFLSKRVKSNEENCHKLAQDIW